MAMTSEAGPLLEEPATLSSGAAPAIEQAANPAPPSRNIARRETVKLPSFDTVFTPCQR
jgi:hypothetical protein